MLPQFDLKRDGSWLFCYRYIHCLHHKPDPSFGCPNAFYVLVLCRESLSLSTRSVLLLMRVKDHWAVCREEAGSPRPTQSLTRALYLNQASGALLHLLTTSWLLISFCVVLFVSLNLDGVWVGGFCTGLKKDAKRMQFFLHHDTQTHNTFFQSYYNNTKECK